MAAMDSLRLAHPWVVAALVPAWAMILWSVRRPAARRPGAAGRAVLACLASALLLVALAGPSVRVEGPAAVCLVQDVSPSMALAGADAAARTVLPPCASALGDLPVGLVQFDTAPALTVAPSRGAPALRLAETYTRSHARPIAAGTDIAAALREAALALPGGRGVLVLWTDARETHGDAVRAASRLAAGGIAIHALLPPLQPPSDAHVVGVQTPAAVEAARAVPIRVRLIASRPMGAAVRLRRLPSGRAPEAVYERRVRIEPPAGAEFLFKDTPPAEGLYVYEAEVAAEADAVPSNNRASSTVRVGPARAVLYVFSTPQPGPLLALVSQAEPGAPVRAVAAHAIPPAPPADTSVVVLDNVSAWALGREASEHLVQAVTRGGVGLLAVGGDAAFSAGGYAESPLEDILPLSSRTGRRPPLELVLVVDASGSMNESSGDVRKLTLAKEAVLALRPALNAADRIGIIAFAGEPRVVSPLVPAADWDSLRDRLLALEAGGGTRITPAVRRAAEMLRPTAGPSDTTVRHVLLLSDGRSEDFDVPRLAALCAEGSASVSAVATGPDADLDRLGRLAEQTGGRLYRSADLARLAETFLADLAWARGEGLAEEPRDAAWRQAEPVWPKAGPPLPPVAEWNLTRPKDGATVHWETREGAVPLLATWRRGLGKVAAMPWPVGRAGGAWTADDLLARSVGRVLAWLRGPGDPADWSARLVEHDGRWRVRVEESPSAIEPVPRRFTASILGVEAREAPDVPLETVGPGFYAADLGPQGAQAASVAVRAGDEPGVRAWLAMPGLAPREYEHFGADLERLDAIAEAGGGQVHRTTNSLAEAVSGVLARHEKPMGVYLVWAAGAVVLVLVAGRLAGRL